MVDGSATWKPYRIVYEVIKALRDRDAGAVVEVITKDDPGILTDLACWCEATGHDLLSTDRNRRDEARLVIRKGAPKRSESTMTVIISTANLEHAVFPLEKAVAGAVLGMRSTSCSRVPACGCSSGATDRGSPDSSGDCSPRLSSG